MRRVVLIVAIAAGVGLLTVLALAAIVYTQRDKIEALLLGGTPPAPVAAHELPPLDVPAELTFIGEEGTYSDGYPKKTVSLAAMVALLRHRRFSELTRHVETTQSAFEADVKKEYWAMDAVRGFHVADPAFEPLLEAWIQHSPNSFVPYLARAQFLSARGWHNRGAKYSRETSRAQFAAMREQHRLARADYERALELRPKCIAALAGLINDAKHGSAQAEFDHAVGLFPLSFNVYHRFMLGETPRWGGSYERLQQIADSAVRYAKKNPRLELLQGFVAWAKAEDRLSEKDYLEMEAMANAALKHGDHWAFYDMRGRARRRLKVYPGALEDFDRALALAPEIDSVLRERAGTLWSLKRHEEAAESFLQALRLEPTSGLNKRTDYAKLFAHAARNHLRDGRPRWALELFDKALLLDPANKDAAHWRSEILKRDPNANEQEVRALVERAEREDTFETYKALDDALARRARFDEVIQHWTRHLEKNPRDGRGFLERGGAYSHVRKGDEALRDAEKACELGVALGCDIARRARAAKPR